MMRSVTLFGALTSHQNLAALKLRGVRGGVAFAIAICIGTLRSTIKKVWPL